MDENQLNNISVIQMAEYSQPEIVESQNADWVSYGEDNDYFSYLIDLFHSSPTNNACITGIVDRAYGKGLKAHRANRALPEYTMLKAMLSSKDIKACLLDLKMLGWCVVQGVKNKAGNKTLKLHHFPANTIRSGKANKDGEIEKYYYHKDWANIQPGEDPKEFKAYNYEGKEGEYLLVIKRYVPGSYYYSPPDYQGSTMWADLECEIANYHNSNIKNGMAPSMLVNFNNGDPGAEGKNLLESKVNQKFAGSSNTGRIMVSFNIGQERAATVEPIQLSDAHSQYEFLSKEAAQKILIGHRVISPKLLGIYDASGFSNNADEIRVASALTEDVTIEPLRNLFIEGISEVLYDNNITLDLYFESIDTFSQPTETVTKQVNMSEVELVKVKKGESEEDFIKRCVPTLIEEGKENDQAVAICKSIYKKSTEMSDDAENIWLEHLDKVGEKMSDDLWEEISVSDVVDDEPLFVDDNIYLVERSDLSNYKISAADRETAEKYAESQGHTLLGESHGSYKFFERFSEPDKKSADDKGIYRIRYRYTPKTAGNDSRTFCKNMVTSAKAGVVYRREDIDKMGDEGINAQFSAKGESTYSIWQYKGGVNCHHKWERVTYRRKEDNGKIIPLTEEEKAANVRIIDENYQRVTNAKADSDGVPFNPPNWENAKTKPINMPNQGRKN